MSYYVMGLGNPGDEYAMTRHNAGRRAVQALENAAEVSPWRRDAALRASRATGVVSSASAGKGRGADTAGERVTLLLPETFMNESGAVAGALRKKRGFAPERLIVVHDDADLPLGSVRVSFNRGAAGHRGVLSVMNALKTKAFVRIRIGTAPRALQSGSEKRRAPSAGTVLAPFTRAEERAVEDALSRAGAAVLRVIEKGLPAAMNEFNAK